MKKILFIIGSLRAKSFNRQVANVAKEMIGNRAEVQELDYSDLPLLNQDIEQPDLEVVARIRKAVAEEPADGGGVLRVGRNGEDRPWHDAHFQYHAGSGQETAGMDLGK